MGERKNIMEYINKYAPNLLILIVVFFAGAFFGVRYFAPALTTNNTTVIKEQPTIVQGETKTETKTQIAYVPKETIIERYIDASGKEITTAKQEDTDLDAQIGKSEFNVRLNGKEIQFIKNDDEKFMFDKNKIALNQTSTITFDTTVSPTVIDKTKRWGIGIGYGSNGVAGKVDFPIGNNNHLGGWLYGDKETKAGGVQVRF